MNVSPASMYVHCVHAQCPWRLEKVGDPLEWRVSSCKLPAIDAREWTGFSAKTVCTLSPSFSHCSIPGNVLKRPQMLRFHFHPRAFKFWFVLKMWGKRERERARTHDAYTFVYSPGGQSRQQRSIELVVSFHHKGLKDCYVLAAIAFAC